MIPLRKILPIPIAFILLALAFLIIVFSEKGFTAAIRGVSIWWDVLFPALFPFFVISEMMLGIGLVHFFGTLLDPMMRPIFRVPGIGGFVMAMGFASGYPVGARLTAQLWEQQLVNRDEGERLVAFTTTSDPIFLIGAVSVGFFQDVSLAGILAVSHYGAGVLVGLLMRYHGQPPQPEIIPREQGSLFLRALRAMHQARITDGRPLGLQFKQAVESSISLILVIGGLVVFFSVVLEVLTQANIMDVLYHFIQAVLHLLSIPPTLSQAVVNGIFEVTLGAKAAAQAGNNIPMVGKLAIAAFILSWGGLSVHAQIISLLHRTNLRYPPFLTARLIHGLLSAVLVFLIWNPMQTFRQQAAVWGSIYDAQSPHTFTSLLPLPYGIILFVCTLIFIALCYLIYTMYKLLFDLTLGRKEE